jgi:acyl-CoA thioesterase I
MSDPDPPATPPATTVRYVALGDSYTIGTSVRAVDRFPDQLVEALDGGPGPGLDLVANLGVDGYTSADLIRDELPVVPSLRAGFATVLIGVNDVVQEVPEATYEAHVRTILDGLLAVLPARRIVTIAVPDYTVTPSGADYGYPVARSAGIRTVNAIMARRSAERGIAFVDIHDLSLRAATDRTLVATDRLHPSGAQYALWVARIAPVARERLSDPG